MKVQRILLAPNNYTWIVLDDKFKPIEPITSFIKYLNNTDKSTHTVRAYANHLKLFWEYLNANSYDWRSIKLDSLAGFVGWLRQKNLNKNIVFMADSIDRKSSSINAILACVASFYKYHNHLGNTDVKVTEASNLPNNRYKSLLYHVNKNKPRQRRIIALKTYKQIPKVISEDKFQILFGLCKNPRDAFLLSLLHETGIRIGQALLLKHEDIVSWDNEIRLVPREPHENEARNKSQKSNIIQVSTRLMELYSVYVQYVQQHDSSGYVFVNLRSCTPLRYSAVKKMFATLSQKSGFKITPHMLRHTHATNLINSGWDPSLVQKRLGHSSIQTTLDIYSHVDQTALKTAFKDYQNRRGK
jgi:site-specific recombinase XerD